MIDLERALQELSRAGVEFIIVGGVAATIHGSARLTQDLDVVYARTPENIERLTAAPAPHSAGGFRVTTFSSAEDFLRAPPREDVACLVLDVHLGGLSGFELQERLAAAGSRIPVLFITARDDAPTRGRARLAGAHDYLRKPFADERLLAAIHKAIPGGG